MCKKNKESIVDFKESRVDTDDYMHHFSVKCTEFNCWSRNYKTESIRRLSKLRLPLIYIVKLWQFSFLKGRKMYYINETFFEPKNRGNELSDKILLGSRSVKFYIIFTPPSLITRSISL